MKVLKLLTIIIFGCLIYPFWVGGGGGRGGIFFSNTILFVWGYYLSLTQMKVINLKTQSPYLSIYFLINN